MTVKANLRLLPHSACIHALNSAAAGVIEAHYHQCSDTCETYMMGSSSTAHSSGCFELQSDFDL